MKRIFLPLLFSMIPLAAAADDKGVWRVFVADATTPAVEVFDIATGSRLDRFSLTSPARVYAGDSGAFVYAVQGEADRVSAIATGFSFEDHGDHADMEVAAPALVGDILSGTTPVHFVPHGDDIAVFFDGEGVTRVFSDQAVGKGDLAVQTYASARPHHGVASAFGDVVLISEPVKDSDAALPDWVRAVAADGTQVGAPHDCPGLHGEAGSGKLTAFGCSDGILVFSPGTEGPVSKHFAYPAELGEGRTGALRGTEAYEMFVGNYGANKLLLIDPSAEEPFRSVEFAGPQIGFELDPARPKFAYALGFDGTLSEINLLGGVITRTLPVTGPYSTEGGHGAVRPALAVAGETIIVSDPEAASLHLIAAESFTASGAIALEGKPASIAAVGGIPASH